MVILGTSVPVVVHGIVVMIEEWTTGGMEEWSVGVIEFSIFFFKEMYTKQFSELSGGRLVRFDVGIQSCE